MPVSRCGFGASLVTLLIERFPFCVVFETQAGPERNASLGPGGFIYLLRFLLKTRQVRFDSAVEQFLQGYPLIHRGMLHFLQQLVLNPKTNKFC
jgi:hypothetical protein